LPAIVALFSPDARVVVVVVDADREDRRGARTEARAKGAAVREVVAIGVGGARAERRDAPFEWRA
jgi:hypothetical protein